MYRPPIESLPAILNKIFRHKYGFLNIKSWESNLHNVSPVPDYIITIAITEITPQIDNFFDKLKKTIINCKSFGYVLFTSNLTAYDLNIFRDKINLFSIPSEIFTIDTHNCTEDTLTSLALDLAAATLQRRGNIINLNQRSIVDTSLIYYHNKYLQKSYAIFGKLISEEQEKENYPKSYIFDKLAIAKYKTLVERLALVLDSSSYTTKLEHTFCSMANFSIQSYIYNNIGGISTDIESSLSKDLEKKLLSYDYDIYYSSKPKCYVPYKVIGDTIDLNHLDIEPAHIVFRRYAIKAILRNNWNDQEDLTKILEKLHLGEQDISIAKQSYYFGSLWHFVQKKSPLLHHRPLSNGHLPYETMRLQNIIDIIKEKPSSSLPYQIHTYNSNNKLIAFTSHD